MKIAIKRLLAFVLCAVFCGVFCLFSSALSTNEYGLGLTANSEEAGGNATVSLKLKNSNDFDVSDITITHNIPDGLALRYEGEISPAHNSGVGYRLSTDILAAGDTYEAELVFATVDSPASNTVEAPVIKKGNEKAVVAAVVAAAVIIAVAIIFAHKHKKAAALLLATALFLPVTGLFGVHAIGTDELRSFTLEDNITIGGKAYPLIITVSYSANTAKNSYFEFETDKKETDDKTVTRPVADFSGTATADSKVISVKYEVRSDIDSFEIGSSGNATLDGCEWSIDNLPLKSGDNKVTFIAALENGEEQTQVQNIFYDRGELYTRTKADEAEENGTKYVKEVVNIYFDIDTADERINEILNEIGAERVGEINDIAMVQARVEADNLDALNKKCEKIEKYSEVIGAGIEQILPLEINAVTNDPWSTYTGYNEARNEEIPGGYNWHIEAVQAHSAWNYLKYFPKATAGIVDGPVMTTHEDLACIKFADSYASDNTLSTDPYTLSTQYHGTHVASVIGATANNGLGGSGLLHDVDIYAANFSSSSASSDTIGYVASAVSSQVTNGAKAVNLSLGLSPAASSTYNPYLDPYSTSDLDSTAKQCAIGMYSLLSAGKEFVVVQSAGNGVTDTRLGYAPSYVKRSVDATQNGLYCSVRQNARYGSLSSSQVNEVYNRIIVVGAAENKSSSSVGAKFQMANFSNGGSRVDIYAPGKMIFGSVTPQKNSSGTYNIIYGSASGTSQAAPMVTAVASLCFAINPSFTGAQVKNLIKNNTCYTVEDNTETQVGNDGNTYQLHPLTGTGKLLNMKLVAEAALKTVHGKADYSKLNRIVATAQSLDPDGFTNYEIVQTVIDSIDYSLYAFQQDLVDAKYIELLDAMDKLIEKTPADYTKVEEAIAQANALNPDDYVDFSTVTSAVNAVVYGKYSDEQSEVDAMAQAITNAIASLVPLAKISSDDYSVIADNANKVIVFTTDYLEYYRDLLNASGGYSIAFTPNSAGTYSTGSTVTLSREGCSDVVYTVAMLGDIDGNGKADANDAFLARMYAVGLLNDPVGAYFIAADADCSGEINESDSMLIQESAIYNNAIFNDYTAGE